VRLRVGVGAEWNFSGNTSLVFSVTYHHGFIDVLRDADGDDIANEEGIFYSEPQNVFDANVKPTFVMSANQHFVALNVGVLF
jgi:long-subunit fatty acid transport protein